MLQKAPRTAKLLFGRRRLHCTARAPVRLSLEKAPVTGKVQPAQGCPGDRLADRSQAAMETAP